MRMIVEAFKDTLELGLEKKDQVVVRNHFFLCPYSSTSLFVARARAISSFSTCILYELECRISGVYYWVLEMRHLYRVDECKHICHHPPSLRPGASPAIPVQIHTSIVQPETSTWRVG